MSPFFKELKNKKIYVSAPLIQKNTIPLQVAEQIDKGIKATLTQPVLSSKKPDKIAHSLGEVFINLQKKKNDSEYIQWLFD